MHKVYLVLKYREIKVFIEYYSKDAYLSFQIFNYFVDANLGGLNAVLRSLEHDSVAVDALAREGDLHAAAVVGDAAQHLAASCHEVPVMARGHRHLALGHVADFSDRRL